jgi:hypothetical protein
LIVYEQREMELGRIEAPDRRRAEAVAAERYGLRLARMQAVASIEATANDLGPAPRQRASKSPVRARRIR